MAVTKATPLLRLWVLGALLMLLTACGGGKGDQIKQAAVSEDALSNTLSPTPPPSTLTGTVAVGAAVVGAQVTVKCLNGTASAVAPTDAVGAFSIALRDLLPPCLLQASGGTVNGQGLTATLHGLAHAAGVANITPLTELTLARALGRDPANSYAAFSGSADMPDAVAIDNAWGYVKAQLQALGLGEPQGSAFQTPLLIGDDNDVILDGLQALLKQNDTTLAELRSTAQNGASFEARLAASKAAAQARLEEELRLAAEAQASAADTVTGFAYAEQPMAAASVRLRCQSGTPQTGVKTDNQGRFQVRRYQAALPCLVQVDDGSRAWHGWVSESGNTVAVTPWSELVMAHALAQLPASAVENWNNSPRTIEPSALNAAKQWLNQGLTTLSLALPTNNALLDADADKPKLVSFAALLQDKGKDLPTIALAASLHTSLANAVLADQPIAIRFTAVSGNTPIRCNQIITNLGAHGVSASLTDFRFYLSEVRLVRHDGVEIPLQLSANNAWQHTPTQGSGVTLIDLEDGAGDCAEEGSADTNPLLTGSVAAGRYVGLRMVLGVPYTLNHTSLTSAPAPLDISAMGWSWTTGRKFAKIEVGQPTGVLWRPANETPRQPKTFYVHLGSTNCSGQALTNAHNCVTANRADIHLPAFNPQQQNIAVDVQALLAGTDITINQGDAAGCMSAGTDKDCLHVFEALGIDWKTDGSGSGLPIGNGLTQTVFRAVSK